jgi:hypothetical protein
MLRQINASTTMRPSRAKKVKKLLAEVLRELTDELEDRPSGER